MTKDNTKIFIDTTVFLGLYNSNTSGNVDAFLHSLMSNRHILITTEQAYHEYLRNRAKIIDEFKNNFITAKVKGRTSSFVRSLDEYEKYTECMKELNTQHEIIIEKIDQIQSDPSKDYIYRGFVKLWKEKNIIKITDQHIELAGKRRMLGNPPGGDKYSGGDEVNWEALINYLDCNLIIVSKDRTFTLNKEYLMYEYKKCTGQCLDVCDTVSNAFSKLSIEMDPKAVGAEDEVRWLDIIVQALRQLGGKGALNEIYEECMDLVTLFYPDKELTNNTIDSTIRRTIYQHSSDVTAYLGKRDLFHRVDAGIWELRNDSTPTNDDIV